MRATAADVTLNPSAGWHSATDLFASFNRLDEICIVVFLSVIFASLVVMGDALGELFFMLDLV